MSDILRSAAYPPPFPTRGYHFTEYGPALNWIGGEWREAAAGGFGGADGAGLSVDNPWYARSMGRVVLSGAADVDAAVAAASAAFPAWRAVPIKERVQVLYRLKSLMERDFEELAWLICHENGKDLAQAQGSVAKAIECTEMGCSLANMGTGEKMYVSRGITCETKHEPLGVCAGITPFNFPLMVPLWMLPQALIAGNTFVLKPSEQVPYGSLKLAALLKEAGLPPGVFNVVHGQREVVEAICDHPDIKAVAFVGSTKVAKLVYARATARGKRALCLGGAKNHLVVVPDADVELTASTLANSAYGCGGQRCMAAALMVAVGDVQHIVDRFVEVTRQTVRLGDTMGAIINQAAFERITGYIDDAERRGAKVLLDGRGAKVEGAPGWWIGPTILDHVTPDMPAYQDEIFGPVFCIVRTRTVDAAIALENAHPYGNAAGIFTTNGGVAEYCIEKFEAGMCGVNIGVPVPREPFAFGGWNDSKFGHGDLTGYDGFRYWTRPRKVTTKWAIHHDETWMS